MEYISLSQCNWEKNLAVDITPMCMKKHNFKVLQYYVHGTCGQEVK
jgi:hypothetical protein